MQQTFIDQGNVQNLIDGNSIHSTWNPFLGLGRTFQREVEFMKFLINYYRGSISTTKKHGANFTI